MSKLSRPQQLQVPCTNRNSSSSLEYSDEEIHTNEQETTEQKVIFKKINSNELKEIIDKNHDETVIIDIRSNRFYQMRHIKYAVNYSCAKKFMSRRSRVRWSRNSCSMKYKTIVVYDEETLDEKSQVDALEFIYHLQQDCIDVRLLVGGFVEFMNNCEDKYLDRKMSSQKIRQYAMSPTHKESLSSDVMKASLSEIITDFLYLGNELDAQDKETLKGHKITDIINVTSNVPFYFESKFNYHRLPASDSDKQDISQYFSEAYTIIENVKKQNGRVFIHCWAGVSRSVTIALMYLIKTKNIDVLEALKLVKEKRGIADPNFNFLGQLSKLRPCNS